MQAPVEAGTQRHTACRCLPVNEQCTACPFRTSTVVLRLGVLCSDSGSRLPSTVHGRECSSERRKKASKKRCQRGRSVPKFRM